MGQLGTLRHSWEDNIKIDVGEIRSECMGWIHVVQHMLSFFLNRPLLPYGVEGFLLVNLLDNW